MEESCNCTHASPLHELDGDSLKKKSVPSESPDLPKPHPIRARNPQSENGQQPGSWLPGAVPGLLIHRAAGG